jgi:hypothetical protein
MGTLLLAIKYVMLGLLAVGIWLASTHGLNAAVHMPLAILLYLYGVATLIMLRRPALPSSFYDQFDDLEPELTPAFYASLALRTGYLLVLRTAFVLLALAFLVSGLGLLAPTMFAATTPPAFVPVMLMIFEHTFPPLTAVAHYALPSATPAALDPTSSLGLVVRLLAYATVSLVIMASGREIWRLVRGGNYAELYRRVHRNNRAMDIGD